MSRHRIRLSGELSADFNCILMRAGTANGWHFSGDLLAMSAGHFEGAPAFLDHIPPGASRSVRDLCGYYSTVQYDPETKSLRAILHLFPHATEAYQIVTAAMKVPRANLGLSADLYINNDGHLVTSIVRVISVDIVLNPAAGGAICAAQEEEPMDPETTVQAQQTTQTPAEPDPATPQHHITLSRRIDASTLPNELLAPIIDDAATGSIDEATALARLSVLEQHFADAQGPTVVRSAPIVMRDGPEQIEVALSRLFGLEVPNNASDMPRLQGLREFYHLTTGDWEHHGIFHPERVQLANGTTSTMAQTVANVLNKVLLRAFEQRPQWWRPIATEVDMPSMQTARWITLGGIADLDTVSEGGAYTEKTWDDYSETSAWIKKGNYIGLTLEMIDRDDIQAVRSLTRRLGLAANRTLAAAISALFTANSGTGPTLADSDPLFDSNHSNLTTTALSATQWDVVLQAMYQQTEYHSSKTLGVRPRYCLVPIELEKTALGIFTSEYEYGASTFDTNVRRGAGRNVITVPEWTDANNWAAVADPLDLEGVMVGYRYGRQPELFVQDPPTAGALFTNDELRFKVRFLYTVGIGDYRALHKANVA